jgi:glycosyltransferase involved in cell wall biosynthesis
MILLAGALVGRGWDVLIVGRKVKGNRLVRVRRQNIRILEMPGFGRRRLGALFYLVGSLSIGLFIGRGTAGFVAIQLSSPATAAGLCGFATRRPFLVMSSTSGFLSEAALLNGRCGAALRRTILARASAVVAQTGVAADELAVVLPGVQVAVVPNPVAPRAHPPLNGQPKVAFSGRLSEEKDLGRLLSVWDELVAERPAARLVLIGAGSAHRSVEAQLRRQVARSARLRRAVRFTGWLPDPAVELVACDVFVFPSLSEGMSNALLEACVLGRVVVASDIPGNVSVLGQDYPLLFEAGSSEQLLFALRTALDDARTRSRCRDEVLTRSKQFAPAAVAEHIERLLTSADRSRH